MTTIEISPDKLAEFEALTLDHGSHGEFGEGACAMEVVSWLADEGFTDAPSCASPVLRRYIINLNDRWDDEKRQTLKPYLLRTIGTGGDGEDARREQIAMEWATRRLLGPWLRLAGLNDEADALEEGDLSNGPEMRRLVRAARDAAWELRNTNQSKLRALVKAQVIEELAKRKKPANANAAAAAAAVAVAVAAAAAVAVADAAAAAAAAADADAVADAVAVAAADAYDGDPWGKSYSAAYKAARAYYDEHPLPISQQVAEIAAEQEDAALQLLDLLIEAA